MIKGLDFFGNTVSPDKAKVDFIKLMLILYSGEVFGFPKYGHEYMDPYNDDSISAAIERASSILVGNPVSVTSIDRSNPHVIKISISSQAEPIELSI